MAPTANASVVRTALPTGDRAPFWNSRAAVIVVGIAAALATLVFYCPSNWMMALLVLLVDGGRTALWIVAAAAAGAALLRPLKLRSNWKLSLASAAGLGLGIFGLIALALGLLGWLNQATSLAMPVLGVAAFALQFRSAFLRSDRFHASTAVKHWLSQRAGIHWLWLIVVISLSTAALGATVVPGDLWKPLDPHPYDVTSYHLQVPREWYEAGKITSLDHNVFSYFPFNVEIQYLLLMHIAGGPWRAMYSCQLLSVGYTLLLALAVAGGAEADEGERESAAAGIIAAAVVCAVPWVIMLAATAYVESALMLYTALSLIWAIRAIRHSTNWKELALSGPFAGLAAGAKITAVPMLVLGIAIAVFLVGFRKSKKIKHGAHGAHGEEQPDKPEGKFIDSSSSVSSVVSVFNAPLIGAVVFIVLAGAFVAPWLIRNIAWIGNPLFPVAMHTLGRGHFTSEQVQRFVTAHSPTPTQQSPAARLAITWREVIANWQYGYLLLPAAAIAAVWRRRDPATVLLLIVAVTTFITWIGFTHLLSRFLIMMIPIAGLLLANLQWRRFWPLGALLAIAAAITGQLGVYDRLTYTTRNPQMPARAFLIGQEDLSFMVPKDLSDMLTGNQQVGLVGDAGAFLYQIPSSRLHYRTVFDLPTNETNPIAAWVGPAAAADPNYLLVINPSEIARLHATYRYVPALPEKWKDRAEPFVIRGGSEEAKSE